MLETGKLHEEEYLRGDSARCRGGDSDRGRHLDRGVGDVDHVAIAVDVNDGVVVEELVDDNGV